MIAEMSQDIKCLSSSLKKIIRFINLDKNWLESIWSIRSPCWSLQQYWWFYSHWNNWNDHFFVDVAASKCNSGFILIRKLIYLVALFIYFYYSALILLFSILHLLSDGKSVTTCKLAHTLFWESKKLVFLHCNLLGIIFLPNFLAALWSSLAAQTVLGSLATKLNNKFTRKCGYRRHQPFIIPNIPTQWNSIRKLFIKWTSLSSLQICYEDVVKCFLEFHSCHNSVN